jgi:phosphoribosyl-AMP cyclohydrolase / phosphoribosyl-ATP pyrophosphohydrolase
MTPAQIEKLDWNKGEGLLPAIVQDAYSGKVLMLGYMNSDALRQTLDCKRVTFFSRSKNRLWTKGETSGNYLELVTVAADCDNDSLLVTAHPKGPTCHTGSESCFGNVKTDSADLAFLSRLESVIAQRIVEKPEGSYTARIWAQGPTKMSQKVGEEGVEVALAGATQSDERLISESADLLFHLALLLKSRNLSLSDAVAELARRHAAKP